jgi:hypothetical protein
LQESLRRGVYHVSRFCFFKLIILFTL